MSDLRWCATSRIPPSVVEEKFRRQQKAVSDEGSYKKRSYKRDRLLRKQQKERQEEKQQYFATPNLSVGEMTDTQLERTVLSVHERAKQGDHGAQVMVKREQLARQIAQYRKMGGTNIDTNTRLPPLRQCFTSPLPSDFKKAKRLQKMRRGNQVSERRAIRSIRRIELAEAEKDAEVRAPNRKQRRMMEYIERKKPEWEARAQEKAAQLEAQRVAQSSLPKMVAKTPAERAAARAAKPMYDNEYKHKIVTPQGNTGSSVKQSVASSVLPRITIDLITPALDHLKKWQEENEWWDKPLTLVVRSIIGIVAGLVIVIRNKDGITIAALAALLGTFLAGPIVTGVVQLVTQLSERVCSAAAPQVQGDNEESDISLVKQFTNFLSNCLSDVKSRFTVSRHEWKERSQVFNAFAQSFKHIEHLIEVLPKYMWQFINWAYHAIWGEYLIPDRHRELHDSMIGWLESAASLFPLEGNIMEACVRNESTRLRFLDLYEEGRELNIQRAEAETSLPPYTNPSFGIVWRKFEDNHEQVAALKNTGGRRIEPVWVYLFGAPDIGKTRAALPLIESIYSYLQEQLGDRDVFTYNESEKFWSGYHGQRVVIHDEHLQAQNADLRSETAIRFLNMVSSGTMSLNMPGLTEKGSTFFSSQLVFTMTNCGAYPEGLAIKDPVAYERRRSFVLEVVGEKPAAFEDTTALRQRLKFRLWPKLRPEKGQQAKIEQVYTFSDVAVLIGEAIKDRRRQHSLVPEGCQIDPNELTDPVAKASWLAREKLREKKEEKQVDAPSVALSDDDYSETELYEMARVQREEEAEEYAEFDGERRVAAMEDYAANRADRVERRFRRVLKQRPIAQGSRWVRVKRAVTNIPWLPTRLVDSTTKWWATETLNARYPLPDSFTDFMLGRRPFEMPGAEEMRTWHPSQWTAATEGPVPDEIWREIRRCVQAYRYETFHEEASATMSYIASGMYQTAIAALPLSLLASLIAERDRVRDARRVVAASYVGIATSAAIMVLTIALSYGLGKVQKAVKEAHFAKWPNGTYTAKFKLQDGKWQMIHDLLITQDEDDIIAAMGASPQDFGPEETTEHGGIIRRAKVEAYSSGEPSRVPKKKLDLKREVDQDFFLKVVTQGASQEDVTSLVFNHLWDIQVGFNNPTGRPLHAFKCFALALGGRLFVTPKHIFAYFYERPHIVIEKGDKKYEFHTHELIADGQWLVPFAKADLIFFRLPRRFPQQRTIDHLFATEEQAVNAPISGYQRVTKQKGNMLIQALGNMTLSAHTADSVDPTTQEPHPFNTERGMEFVHSGKNGICSSPYVNDGKIYGIHTAATEGVVALSFGCFVTQEDITWVRKKVDAQPYIVPQAKYVPEDSPVPGTELIGRIPWKGHVGHTGRTQRLKSPISPLLPYPTFKVPALLRPKDGIDPWANGIAPMASRINGPIARSHEKIALNVIAYQVQPTYPLRCLTCEEVVFGIPDVQYLEALKRDTSPGYPWNLRQYLNDKRQLWDPETRWISPTLVAIVTVYFIESKEGKVRARVVTMNLKDELRPPEKVAQGKTRIF